nr:unnamed protein product [Callosobruchus chinensis]
MRFAIFGFLFIYFLNHGTVSSHAEIVQPLAEMMLDQLYSLKSHHSRHIREVATGTQKHIAHIEFRVKSTCKENGHDAEKLEKTLEECKACVQKKKIFVDTADDYINNMEKCSKHLIKQLEECLPEKVRYLPSFIFHLFESLIRLLYHDTIIIETEIHACLPKLKSEESVTKYNDCCNEVTSRINDIPQSKAEFCR